MMISSDLPENFCIFILTHGRPYSMHTYDALKRQGYTGKIYIIIDDEDSRQDEYYKIYKEQVIVFSKKEMAEVIDVGDNFDDRRAVVYARNACFTIAKSLGMEYFLVLDDDYSTFSYKVIINNIFTDRVIKNLDKMFFILLNYYKNIEAKSIAMAQGGDYIGGNKSGRWEHGFYPLRKCMNTFFCSTSRPFQFVGKINEDVNTYVVAGSRGELFFTIPDVKISQQTTQASNAGLTDIYLDSGTYVKSFYTVLYAPSCVKISVMGAHYYRIHHRISWKHAVPVILHEKYKKDAA